MNCQTDKCDRGAKVRGFCPSHYAMAMASGELKPLPKESVEDRFWKKVDQSQDGCWIWTGAIKDNGYGVFWFRQKVWHAHRASYAMHVGEPPEGLDLDHLCRVRHCVNPEHLEPVTRLENALRGIHPWVLQHHANKRAS